jgi:hypothetical protein
MTGHIEMPAAQIPELETELHYFSQHRVEFYDQAPGRFALIKGTQLLGIFDDERSAIRQGYVALGNVPFLVKQITEADIPLTFTSFNLGV